MAIRCCMCCMGVYVNPMPALLDQADATAMLRGRRPSYRESLLSVRSRLKVSHLTLLLRYTG